MKFIIKYGTNDNSVDITHICVNYSCINNIIYIPKNDHHHDRVNIFGDPLFGIVKKIFIYDNTGLLLQEGSSEQSLWIDIVNNIIYKDNAPENIKNLFNHIVYPKEKLEQLQNTLIIKHGNFSQEYPEQLMTTMFLKGNENVLELGANIGRNSLIIARILQNHGHQNLVSLETDSIPFEKLKENRDINGFHFHIENRALSKRKLIQKEWTTIPSNVVKEGWTPVSTITYKDLCEKYKIKFDTLIADCEGALLPILLDMPEILSDINLIITENDYKTQKEKDFLDYILKFNGFNVVYTSGLCMNCHIELACYYNFYEVWKKESV